MSRNDAAGLDRAKVRSTSTASRTLVTPNTTAYKADRVELREMSRNVSSGALFDGTRRCWRHRATIRGSRRIAVAAATRTDPVRNTFANTRGHDRIRTKYGLPHNGHQGVISWPVATKFRVFPGPWRHPYLRRICPWPHVIDRRQPADHVADRYGTLRLLSMILGGDLAMAPVQREIRRDIEYNKLWGLEIFEREIVGCLGPFATDAAVPRHLDEMTFERNRELLRWLSRKGLTRETVF